MVYGDLVYHDEEAKGIIDALVVCAIKPKISKNA